MHDHTGPFFSSMKTDQNYDLSVLHRFVSNQMLSQIRMVHLLKPSGVDSNHVLHPNMPSSLLCREQKNSMPIVANSVPEYVVHCKKKTKKQKTVKEKNVMAEN